MYGNILLRMLNWTSLHFAVSTISETHQPRAIPIVIHLDSSFLTIWDIYVLANYPNAMVIAESGLWDHSTTHIQSTVLSLNGWTRHLDLALPWAPPFSAVASCVPYSWLCFWCADTTSWSQTCVQWPCSGSCENQHPFLCSRVTRCYNTISICKECALSKGVTADRVLLSLCFSIMWETQRSWRQAKACQIL